MCRYEGLDWEAIAPHTTHLILFSIEMKANGELDALDRLPSRKSMNAARAAAVKYGTKLLICFGGYGRTNGYSEMVRSSASRNLFLTKLVALCDELGLDGVDYNWEYPRGKADWDGLSMLVRETKEVFKGTGRVITMAYYPDGVQEHAIVVHDIHRYVDLLHMMAYDQSGKHSTTEFAETATMRSLTQLPARQVTLGLPFYSRHMHSGDWKTYEDLLKEHNMPPGKDEVAGHYLNGVWTIERKTRAAVEQWDLGGVMIWEVGQDCLSGVCGHDGEMDPFKHSLLMAVSRIVNRTNPMAKRQVERETAGKEEL